MYYTQEFFSPEFCRPKLGCMLYMSGCFTQIIMVSLLGWSYLWQVWDVVLKTYLGRWTIGRSGERGSGISMLPARYDDDEGLHEGIQKTLQASEYQVSNDPVLLLNYRNYIRNLLYIKQNFHSVNWYYFDVFTKLSTHLHFRCCITR